MRADFDQQDQKYFELAQASAKAQGWKEDSKDMPLIGPGRAPSPDRLYYRQLNGTRLYTEKYMKQVKGDGHKATKRFLRMAQHMAESVQRETISRARQMVEQTQKEFTAEFESEANVMLEQHVYFKKVFI